MDHYNSNSSYEHQILEMTKIIVKNKFMLNKSSEMTHFFAEMKLGNLDPQFPQIFSRII